MSKFYRVILSLAGVCLVLGIMICIIAGVNGGVSILRNGIHNNWNFDYNWNYDNDNDSKSSSRYDYEDINKTFDGDIKSLDIKIPYGEVTIQSGSGFSFDAKDVIKNSFDLNETDDGVLEIKQNFNFEKNRNDFWNIFGIHIGKTEGYKSPEITITVPEGFVAEEFNLDFEVGKIDIYDISSVYSNLKVGVGDCYINNLKAGEIDVLGNVGQIDMEDVTLKNLDFENQFGSVSIQGKLTGECEISTGVGETFIDIDGDEDDYYLDLNKGLGEVRFNDSRIRSSVGDSSAENRLNVDTGVGEVRINID